MSSSFEDLKLFSIAKLLIFCSIYSEFTSNFTVFNSSLNFFKNLQQISNILQSFQQLLLNFSPRNQQKNIYIIAFFHNGTVCHFYRVEKDLQLPIHRLMNFYPFAILLWLSEKNRNEERIEIQCLRFNPFSVIFCFQFHNREESTVHLRSMFCFSGQKLSVTCSNDNSYSKTSLFPWGSRPRNSVKKKPRIIYKSLRNNLKYQQDVLQQSLLSLNLIIHKKSFHLL